MATSSIYTDEELLKKYKAADCIYGTMYGEKIDEQYFVYSAYSEPKEHTVEILEIKIHYNSPVLTKDENGYYLWWVWGWPGPNANIYYFSDYGRTWAFTEEELEANRYKKDVSSDE